MTLSPLILTLVLVAAVCHASWNALVKSGGDKLVMQTYVICVPGLISLFALPFLPLPDPASWPYLFTSVVVHQAYYLVLIYAYRFGDLSQVYPISRGLAPALVALGAWLLAGEGMNPTALFGLAILSCGILMLSRVLGLLSGQEKPRQGEGAAIALALASAATIGIYSTADGLGVREAGSALSYILWLLFLESVPLLLVALWLRRDRLREAFLPSLAPGIAGGLIGGLAYGLVIWCMGQAPLAHVVALRETSVIMAAFIGTRLMGEPFGRKRMIAALLVACGAALLQLGGF